MLSDLIKNGFGEEEDLNCAEKILYAANREYNLGLDKSALKLAAGFGGGMGYWRQVWSNNGFNNGSRKDFCKEQCP